MTNLREDLQLIEVEYKDKKAILTFLDIENGEVLEVNFNKQVYDQSTNKFVDDAEKEEQVEKWCQDYFGCTFDELDTKVGEKKNVYKYEKFNSLWEADVIEKFTTKDKGKIFETEIKEVIDDGIAIKIRFEYEGKTYESKMTYSKYVEELKKWFEDPQKKASQFKKFEDKFGVSVDKADEIVGKSILVEVGLAFGKFAYCEIKKPNWA